MKINWNKFSEKKPEHNDVVLMGRNRVDYSDGKEVKRFVWTKALIQHPFQESEIYNPNYYNYKSISLDHDFPTTGIIKDDWIWAYIENSDMNE